MRVIRDVELGETGPCRAALYSGATRRALETPVDSHSTTRDAAHVRDASHVDDASLADLLANVLTWME